VFLRFCSLQILVALFALGGKIGHDPSHFRNDVSESFPLFLRRNLRRAVVTEAME
jgi:hypothetical protein